MKNKDFFVAVLNEKGVQARPQRSLHTGTGKEQAGVVGGSLGMASRLVLVGFSGAPYGLSIMDNFTGFWGKGLPLVV